MVFVFVLVSGSSPFSTSFFTLWAGSKFFQAWEIIFGALRSNSIVSVWQCKGTHFSRHLQIFSRFGWKNAIFVLKIEYVLFLAPFLAPKREIRHLTPEYDWQVKMSKCQDVKTKYECQFCPLYNKIYIFYIIVSNLTTMKV